MSSFDQIRNRYGVDIEVDEKGDVLVFCSSEQQAEKIWEELECEIPYVIVIKDGVISRE